MFRRSQVVVGCAFGVLTALVGCAMSQPADLGPDVNPAIPGLDAAGGGSLPSDPNRDASTTGGDDDGSADAFTPMNVLGGEGGTDSSPPPSGPAAPAPGEIVISEIMFAPTTPEPASEWIELHSLATSDRKLTGLTLKDGGARLHVIGSLTIAAGAYVLLVRSRADAITAQVPGAATAYEYGTGLATNQGIVLANSTTGGIGLYNGSTLLVNAPYGGWYAANGESIQLDVLTMAASTAKASWCLSANAWATGTDKGTPGKPNDCP